MKSRAEELHTSTRGGATAAARRRRRVAMRAGASADPLRVPLAEPTADASAGSASGDDAHDDAPSTSGRPPSSPSGGLRGILRALRDPSCGPRLRRLLLFTSLREFKPSEPFLVELYETRGLTSGALTRDVFPSWTHARLPALILVCAFAARLGCRRAVILGTVSGMVTVGMTVSFALFVKAHVSKEGQAEDEPASDEDQHEEALYVFGVPALAWVRLSQAFAAFAFASHQAFLGIAFSTPSPSPRSYPPTYVSAPYVSRIGPPTRFDPRRIQKEKEKQSVENASKTFPATSHGVKAATLVSTCVSAVIGHLLLRSSAPLVSLFAISFLTQMGSLIVVLCSFTEEEEEETISVARVDDDDEVDLPGSLIEQSRDARNSARKPRVRVRFDILRRTVRASRAIVSNPSVAAWCLWSVASAPTHAFVAANWQTLVADKVGGGDEAKTRAFAYGAWLAAQRAAAFLATLFVGAFAYGALVTHHSREEEEEEEEGETSARPPFANRHATIGAAGRHKGKSSPLAATLASCSFSLGALSFSLLGASFARRTTGVAVFVTFFFCVFEATSSVCAAAVGLGAASASVFETRADASERVGDGGSASFRGEKKSARRRATSLAFVFASLSAFGYLVDVGTQGVTDLLSLGVRERFETRAAFVTIASAAFGAFAVFGFFVKSVFTARPEARPSATSEDDADDAEFSSLLTVEDS